MADAALDARLAGETLDVTLPPRPENSGSVHPISQVLDEVVAIFAELGFGVAEGPDVEFDDYNFTKLNIPPDHPARQMQDTFYVAPQADGIEPCAAHPHLAGAGARHAERQAAHPHHLAGPHLSRGFATPPIRPCSTRSKRWWWTRAFIWAT